MVYTSYIQSSLQFKVVIKVFKKKIKLNPLNEINSHTLNYPNFELFSLITE